MDILTTLVVFGAILALGYFLSSSRATEAERAQELLRRMAKPEEVEEVEVTHKRRPEEGPLIKMAQHLNVIRKLEENMWQAGLYVRVSDVILIMVLLFGAGGAAGEAYWQDLPFALAAGAALSIAPLVYISFRKQSRLKAFANQLPFALDLIKSGLEAGHSLLRALQVVVQEFHDPIGGEFRTVIEQVRLGLPLSRALDDMYKRVPEDDLRMLLVAVKVQSDVGSSLAGIVGRLSEVIRTRQRLRLQVRSLTAQARMGGIIVGLLPVLVLLAFSAIQPSYTAVLFHDPSGIKILKTAITLDVLAFVTIRKLTKVKY
ncbi:MAG: type II secretion system F family protein [Candidatus Binataceae bacterium]